LIQPFVQIKFGSYILLLALAYCGLVAALLWISYREQYAQFIAFYQGMEGDLLFREKMLGRYLFGLSGILLTYVLTIFTVVILRTHKIYGPMVAIRRFVEDLGNGNYSGRLRIRERDDFQDLAQNLNEVAQVLENRKQEIANMAEQESRPAPAENPPETRRTPLRSMVARGDSQVKFSLLVIGISIAFVLTLSAFTILAIDTHNGLLGASEALDSTGTPIDWKLLFDEALILGGVLSVFLLSMLVLILERTGRIYGPIVGINRLLHEIRHGNYSARVGIRSGDEFRELADRLNALAATLEKQSSSTTP
jgi:methyl-accepting chemotaxis protein